MAARPNLEEVTLKNIVESPEFLARFAEIGTGLSRILEKKKITAG